MGHGWGRAYAPYGPYGPPVPGPYYSYPYGASYPHSPQDEEEFLRQEAQHLEASLKEIKERLVKLEEKEQEQPQKEKSNRT